MGGAVPPLPQCPFMAWCTEATFLYVLEFKLKNGKKKNKMGNFYFSKRRTKNVYEDTGKDKSCPCACPCRRIG
jgi:hypothetical protein